jgi:conjugative transfer region protein TrbK
MSRSLIGKGLILAGAAMILTLIVIGTFGDIRRDGQGTANPSPPITVSNPQQAALQRCQSLGEAATTDAACLALWAETRQRFLTPSLPTDEGN